MLPLFDQLSGRRWFLFHAAVFVAALAYSLLQQSFFWLAVPFVVLFVPVFIRYTHQFYFLLLLLLPLGSELELSPTLSTDFPDELLMWMITGAFFLIVIINRKLVPAYAFSHPLFFLILLHVGWAVVSCVSSEDSWLSVKWVLAKIWYIVPFVVLPSMFINTKSNMNKALWCLAVPMLLVCIQSLLRHSFYNFSFEGIKETVSPFFRNHVAYSAMLVCLMVPVVAAYFYHPKGSAVRKPLAIIIAIGLAGIVFAYSRGAWVAAIMGIAAAFIIRKKLMAWMMALTIIIVTTFSIWLAKDNNYLRFANQHDQTIFHSNLGQHLEATLEGKDVSNAERFYRWVAGTRMSQEKLWTGYGPNNFYPHYKNFTVTAFTTWVSDNPEHSSVHNYFLLMLIEQGIPGLLFFVTLFFAMFLYAQRLYHRLHDRYWKFAAMCIGIILTMIGGLIFMSDLIETDKIGSLFWLCAGILMVLERFTPNAGRKKLGNGT
ncbi:MAG: O-antigen ligase family protein [Bacteroidota bacterium]